MNVHYFNCDYRLYSLLSKLSNVNLITAADKVWSSGTSVWNKGSLCAQALVRQEGTAE